MIYSVNDVTIMFVLRTMNDNFSGTVAVIKNLTFRIVS